MTSIVQSFSRLPASLCGAERAMTSRIADANEYSVIYAGTFAALAASAAVVFHALAL